MNRDTILNFATLDELIRYDPITGDLRNKVKRGHMLPDSKCGGTNGSFRNIVVSIHKERFYATTIIHILMTKKKPHPDLVCDFTDGDTLNLKWDNLEWITFAEHNKRKANREVEKYPGVYRDQYNGRYYARGKVKGVAKFLGSFKTFEEAVAIKRAFDEKRGYPVKRKMS